MLHPEYRINVDALEKVQPVDLDASEIYVRLGSAWIEPEIYRQFLFELLEPSRNAQENITVKYSKATGAWNIEGKSYDRYNINASSVYGTERADAYRLMEDSLNLRETRITDREYVDGKERYVLNRQETMLAGQKQEAIKEAFSEWIFQNPERRENICRQYNELFNSVRPREYDGSYLTFPGMSPEITLMQHQKNGVARILLGGNTLLAHVVGAGKTFSMIAGAMEKKRLGLCRKSMFLVPNHLTEQWGADFCVYIREQIFWWPQNGILNQRIAENFVPGLQQESMMWSSLAILSLVKFLCLRNEWNDLLKIRSER